MVKVSFQISWVGLSFHPQMKPMFHKFKKRFTLIAYLTVDIEGRQVFVGYAQEPFFWRNFNFNPVAQVSLADVSWWFGRKFFGPPKTFHLAYLAVYRLYRLRREFDINLQAKRYGVSFE